MSLRSKVWAGGIFWRTCPSALHRQQRVRTKLRSMLETESQLSEELELLTKAFDDMQVSYKELLKNFDEKV